MPPEGATPNIEFCLESRPLRVAAGDVRVELTENRPRVSLSVSSAPGCTQCVGDVQPEQNAIAKIEFLDSCDELVPCEHGLIGRPEVRGRPQLTRRILREEALVDCLRKDVAHVSPDLQHTVL